MVDQTVLNILVPLFVAGALAVFVACGAATLVLMVHLTSMPERRRARRPAAEAPAAPAASFAD